MITITRFEMHQRTSSASCGSTALEDQLARAVRAVSNVSPSLSHSEFFPEMSPRESGQLMEWSEIQKWNRAWLQRVLNAQLVGNAAELTKTTRAVFEVLARYGSSAINLQGFGSRVNGMHLAMVLRATADELDATEPWKKALGIARTALEAAGVDPKVALYGLTSAE